SLAVTAALPLRCPDAVRLAASVAPPSPGASTCPATPRLRPRRRRPAPPPVPLPAPRPTTPSPTTAPPPTTPPISSFELRRRSPAADAGSIMSFEDKAITSCVTSPSPKAVVSESDPNRLMVSSNMEDSQTIGQANAVLGPVAIFWDIEKCPVPSDVQPDDVAGNVRMALRMHPIAKGAETMLSAYGDFNAFPRRLREGCQRTGVKLVDVPNGRKDAANKAILVDMFLFALDNHPPSSIMLISDDVDFAPVLHILGQRGYTIVLAIPSSVTVSSTLSSAGSVVWDWPSLARGEGIVALARSLTCCLTDPPCYVNNGNVGQFHDNNQNEEEPILYTVNDATIMSSVRSQLNNLERAINLAMRANLPGVENLSVPVQTGQTTPHLQHLSKLLTQRKLNAFESLELSQHVINQNKKHLLENWLGEDKLECSEELGDIVKAVDSDLALRMYINARATPKVAADFSERREFDKILIYSKQVGYTPDYLILLQTLLDTDPQGAVNFALMMSQMEGGCPVDYNTITELFLERDMIREATAFLLDVLKPNLPEHASLQTKVLEINLVTLTDPNVADAILANGMFSHYDHPRIGQLCEKAGFYLQALQHYSELSDIKRVIVNAHAIEPQALVKFFGTLSREWALECMKDLLLVNLRGNLQIVVQAAKEYSEQLGVDACIKLFEQFESSEPLYLFLGSYLSSSNFYTDDELEKILLDWIDNPNFSSPIKKLQIFLYDIEQLQGFEREAYCLVTLEKFRNNKFKRKFNKQYKWYKSHTTSTELTERTTFQFKKGNRVVENLRIIEFSKKIGPKDMVLVKIKKKDAIEEHSIKNDNKVEVDTKGLVDEIVKLKDKLLEMEIKFEEATNTIESKEKQISSLQNENNILRLAAQKVENSKPPKKQRSEPSVVHPWSSPIRNALLETIDGDFRNFSAYHKSNKVYYGKMALTSLNVSKGKVIELGGRKYQIKGFSGAGAFAKVYKATVDGNAEEIVALKIQSPPFPWEFYMYRQLDMRISDVERPSFGYAHEIHTFSDVSVLLCDYMPHGSLLDVINSYFSVGQHMDEVLCMYQGPGCTFPSSHLFAYKFYIFVVVYHHQKSLIEKWKA
ncbi:hypothetical protein U9M48_037697, partial [Paspalum notatum var. saurae]